MFGFIAKLVITIIATALSYHMAKKADNSRPAPASFEDFEFPQCNEGTPIAYVFGDVWLEDWMVLGVGNYRVVQKDVKV